MKRIQKRQIKRGGFTLIEMLVVLAIIVLLAAMVGPRILGQRKKADIQSTVGQIGLLESALQQYSLDMRTFPNTEEGLIALVKAPSEEEDTEDSNWAGPYMSKTELPKDPWSNEYQYAYPPEHNKSDTPDIWSLGPDGEDNTEDDITNWTKEEDEGGEDVIEDTDE